MKQFIFLLLLVAFLIPANSQEKDSLDSAISKLGLKDFGLNSSSEFGGDCLSKLELTVSSRENESYILDSLPLLPSSRSKFEVEEKRTNSTYKTPILNPPDDCYGGILDPYYPEQYSLIIINPE